ncbi:MAG: hypothetical protein WC966_11415 [Bradymonadales bacterium]
MTERTLFVIRDGKNTVRDGKNTVRDGKALFVIRDGKALILRPLHG